MIKEMPIDDNQDKQWYSECISLRTTAWLVNLHGDIVNVSYIYVFSFHRERGTTKYYMRTISG